MPCEICHAPMLIDGETGERFCAEDPSHGVDEDEEWPYGGI